MAMPQRTTYKKKAPPGFRWKTVTKMNAMGRPYTTHVLVPIESAKVPPETIFTAEESIRGAEDRKDSMPDMRTVPTTKPTDGLLAKPTEEPFRPPAWASTLTDPNQLPAEAAGRNRPRGSFSSLQMVPGATPPNPYKDNVGPIYGEEMRNVNPNSVQGLLIADNPPGKYGGIQGYDSDGQPFYLSDVIDIGAAGKINIGRGMIDVGTKTWNRIRKLFKGKQKSEFDSKAAAGRTRTEKGDTTVGGAAESAADATKAASTTSRTRRALSKIAPGRKTELTAAGVLSAGLAGELTDNALWNRFKDATVEQLQKYGFTPEQIIKIAKEGKDAIVQAATETTPEYEARLARGEAAKSIRAKGLLTLPDRDARAGTEFFGAGDVAGDSLTPEKAKTPVAAVEDPLKKFWGKYADDPAKRKQKYLDSLSSIWRKAAIMDAVAAATGGESRSPQFMAMMSQRMDAIAKFDDEERLHNIFKAVYYNPETGAYNPPKDKTDAYERAIKLGANPAEAKKIFGYQPEPDQDLVEWYYKDPVTGEYVTEHVRGKDTMPEGDYNWSKGKTPIVTEAAEDLGGTMSERTWGEINTILDRGGDLSGRFDDALRAYMRAMKVDSYTGYDGQVAKREAEERILDTMDSNRRKQFTYPEIISAELAATKPIPEELKELLKKAREAGYLFVVDSSGVEHPVLTEV